MGLLMEQFFKPGIMHISIIAYHLIPRKQLAFINIKLDNRDEEEQVEIKSRQNKGAFGK